MFSALFELAAICGSTFLHLLPYFAAMGVLFAALSWFSPCNAGKPWWQKRGIATDVTYLFMTPVLMRMARIGFSILIAVYLLGITTTNDLVAFFDHGHGPVSRLPFWLQLAGYLILSDLALYWIHRAFHSGFLWKYHAVHHSSEDVEWLSAWRFHPVNVILGSVAVDVAAIMAGINTDVFFIVSPFAVLSSGWVHANLNWTLGPLKYVVAGPVFHRWHHTREKEEGVNFAGTFSLWDWMFGTFYMPDRLPENYGIGDKNMPESFGMQVVYPILN